MDEIVKQAMAKWPNVPSVFGWLGLDRRGKWRIKGERIANPASPISSAAITSTTRKAAGFSRTGRSACSSRSNTRRSSSASTGTPIPRAALRIEAHTGRAVHRIDGAWIDDAGIVLLATDAGVGMIDDRDLERLLPCFTDAARRSSSTEEAIAACDRTPAGRRRRRSVLALSRQRGAGDGYRSRRRSGTIRLRAAAGATRRRGRMLLRAVRSKA